MQSVDPNYRIARGIAPARSLVSSLFHQPGPRPDMVYGISNMDTLERIFPEFSMDFGYPARLEAGIPSRFIYTSIKGPVYGRSDQRLHRKSRYLPPDQLDGCADLSIIGDTVVFMTVADSEVVAQAITNPALAGQMRAFFKFMWNHAAP